jgi:hypothetical protein
MDPLVRVITVARQRRDALDDLAHRRPSVGDAVSVQIGVLVADDGRLAAVERIGVALEEAVVAHGTALAVDADGCARFRHETGNAAIPTMLDVRSWIDLTSVRGDFVAVEMAVEAAVDRTAAVVAPPDGMGRKALTHGDAAPGARVSASRVQDCASTAR